MSHGGARRGAGGPPKPPLTLAELERARARCAEQRGGRVNAQGIVDAINEERTRGYLDPRSKAKLSVSTWWVRRQTKMLRQSSEAQKLELETVRAIRAPEYPATVQQSMTISERPTDGVAKSPGAKVESEQSQADDMAAAEATKRHGKPFRVAAPGIIEEGTA